MDALIEYGNSEGYVSCDEWVEETLEEIKRELDDDIFAQKFYQFVFFKQWNAVKKYANESGVRIIGDVPIFVALDSADVWCNPSQFKLNEDGSPSARTQAIWGHTPMKRFGESHELIGACVFLAAHKASSFVTGIELVVDGGFLAQTI